MKNKIDAIQDLRGIAILYIVLFHIGNVFNFRAFSHGASGIAIFFVISGFTIAYPYTKRDDRGGKEFFLFAKKRIARVYFPYFLPFAVMLLLYFMSGKGGEQSRDIVNVVRNFFLIQRPSQSIHPYAWFLVYIVYFYATFCVFVILFQLNVFTYAILTIIPYLLSKIIGIDVSKDIIPCDFSNLLFASGVIISIFYDKVNFCFKSGPVILALLAFLVAPALGSDFWVLICAAILFFIYAKSALSFVILRSIGNASYSIYLTHAIVLGILKNIVDSRSVSTFTLFFFCCVGMGYLYYLFMEIPIVSYAHKLLKIE